MLHYGCVDRFTRSFLSESPLSHEKSVSGQVCELLLHCSELYTKMKFTGIALSNSLWFTAISAITIRVGAKGIGRVGDNPEASMQAGADNKKNVNVPTAYRMNMNHNWIIYWKNTKIFLRCWERFGIWLSEWFVYLKPIPETMESRRDEMEMFETVQTMMLSRSMRILRRVLEISGNLSQFSAMTITYLVWICKYFNDNNNDKNDKWNNSIQIMAQEGWFFFFNLERRNIQDNLGVIYDMWEYSGDCLSGLVYSAWRYF